MQELRKVPFLIALVVIVLCVLLEVGGTSLLRGKVDVAAKVESQITNSKQFQDAAKALGKSPHDLFVEMKQAADQESRPPGFGISFLALIDIILVYSLALMALAFFVPQHTQGKIQGILTLIFSLVLIFGGIILIIISFILFTLMVSLFFSAPFGTIIYLALFGFFDTGRAGLVLTLLWALKLGFVVSLLLANQRFLKNKGLVLLVLTSLLANLIVSFLQGIVPFFLVSITDALASVIVAILAVIWGIVMLVGAIIGIVEAILTR